MKLPNTLWGRMETYLKKGEKVNDVNKMKTIPSTTAADENVVQ